MLQAHGLACDRGDRRLFSGVDFTVPAGQWLQIEGANGAGKTSLLRILAGLAGAARRDPGARLAAASLIDGAIDARAP